MQDRTKFIIGLLLLLGVLALGVWQFNVMRAYKIDTDTLNTEASTLTLEKKVLIDEYQEIKVDLADDRESANQSLENVFPTDEDLTILTRMFDDFAVKNNFSSNPFFISSINYQSSVKSADGNYRYVPISLSVKTSEKNLNKFLEYLESSGSLEGKTRLMGIEAMTVNYPSEYGGVYDVKFEIYAYFSQEI